MHKNVSAARLILTLDKLAQLEQAISQIAIQGERHPAQMQQAIDR